MLPFAGWILLGNAITNIFGVLDRYMIMHFSNIPPANVLDVIGNYHSSRVVPVLLISIATMLGAMILPHLTHDWEAGRRAEVASRLQLCVKLIGFGMFAVAVMVLIGSPLLFDLAYRGKFPGGEAVFPLALVYSTWFGLIFILHDYLLCAEHARLTSAALFVGLLVNIGLNLLLLPRFGLDGAVLATAAANGVSLLLICVFNYRLGFRIDDGTQLVLVLPVFLCAGPWVAGLSVVLTLLLAIGGNRLLSPEEKRQIAASLADYKERSGLDRWLTRPSRQ
jgi:O-antigen/teichoic acid export membrane protein